MMATSLSDTYPQPRLVNIFGLKKGDSNAYGWIECFTYPWMMINYDTMMNSIHFYEDRG